MKQLASGLKQKRKLKCNLCERHLVRAYLMFCFFIIIQRGNRADGLESFVQVEVDGKVLGVSDTKQVEPAEQWFDYDFTCSFQCSKVAQALDDIAHKPIICKSRVC